MKKGLLLRGPVEYWEQKKKRHMNATVLVGCVFLLYCTSGVCSFFSEVIRPAGGLQAYIEQWSGAGLGGLGILAGVAAMFLMLARVIYRIFASQLHLWNDAAERVTVIKTYLALAEKGHAKEEFLAGLMNRLFAPASDGVVKDDLGSVGPIDAVVRQITGR
ncbi:hypothetical protein GV832_17690 [Rhodobacteraceae bacterium CYK-10]|uniref:DUF6161 domain-containing protein n=1 Tax=Stagnihabitans tardus TaxID=2699202 RepID=A0AAE4YDP5_9RHOB|nr:hypothetical protein [Stagnihabitans tardus]